jgi:hypothetical protein
MTFTASPYYWLKYVSLTGEYKAEGPFPGIDAAYIWEENHHGKPPGFPMIFVVCDDLIVGCPDEIVVLATHNNFTGFIHRLKTYESFRLQMQEAFTEQNND